MTEEITYANLKFENHHELYNITKPEDTKEKGPPTSPRSCWPVVLILLTLCLVLLTVLIVLAVLLFQIPKDYRTQLRILNMTKNELHANFSNMLRAIGNQLCLEGQNNMKNNGQNCVLCPANWDWRGGDTCYYISEERKTWEQSYQFCSSQNSTLLLIKDRTKLEFIKKNFQSSYWVGLSFKVKQNGWYWSDNTTLTEEQKSWIKVGDPYYCVVFVGSGSTHITSCTYGNSYICEKSAIQLQRGNNHWQKNWSVRPK